MGIISLCIAVAGLGASGQGGLVSKRLSEKVQIVGFHVVWEAMPRGVPVPPTRRRVNDEICFRFHKRRETTIKDILDAADQVSKLCEQSGLRNVRVDISISRLAANADRHHVHVVIQLSDKQKPRPPLFFPAPRQEIPCRTPLAPIIAAKPRGCRVLGSQILV